MNQRKRRAAARRRRRVSREREMINYRDSIILLIDILIDKICDFRQSFQARRKRKSGAWKRRATKRRETSRRKSKLLNLLYGPFDIAFLYVFVILESTTNQLRIDYNRVCSDGGARRR